MKWTERDIIRYNGELAKYIYAEPDDWTNLDIFKEQYGNYSWEVTYNNENIRSSIVGPSCATLEEAKEKCIKTLEYLKSLEEMEDVS